jgi:hypothetical protein
VLPSRGVGASGSVPSMAARRRNQPEGSVNGPSGKLPVGNRARVPRPALVARAMELTKRGGRRVVWGRGYEPALQLIVRMSARRVRPSPRVPAKKAGIGVTVCCRLTVRGPVAAAGAAVCGLGSSAVQPLFMTS